MKPFLYVFILLLIAIPAHAVDPDEFIGLEFRSSQKDKPGTPSGSSGKSKPHKAGDIWTDPTTGMQFVWVPGGCFKMGSNSGSKYNKPVHEVCVDSFWLGKFEVTNAQFRKFRPGYFNDDYKGNDLNGEMQPANISWHDATAFVNWLSSKGNGRFRLPTEAEWEFAARSRGKNERYPGGGNADSVSWYYLNSRSRSHNVGTKPPNGLGLYDMSGNAWEWCEDWFDKNAYSSLPKDNPVCRNSASGSRVLRGGCWDNGAGIGTTFNRYSGDPKYYHYYWYGLRVVRQP